MEDNVDTITSSKKMSKETHQLSGTQNNRKCLEAHYSGTASLPLLTNRSPFACNVVKHKDVVIDSEMESVTTMDLPTNATTPSDVRSMSITSCSSPFPSSLYSLASVDDSSTHSRSGSATPTVRSGEPVSCDPSPTHNLSGSHDAANPIHNHSLKEQCEYYMVRQRLPCDHSIYSNKHFSIVN